MADCGDLCGCLLCGALCGGLLGASVASDDNSRSRNGGNYQGGPYQQKQQLYDSNGRPVYVQQQFQNAVHVQPFLVQQPYVQQPVQQQYVQQPVQQQYAQPVQQQQYFQPIPVQKPPQSGGYAQPVFASAPPADNGGYPGNKY